ncbi:MAG TPA: hypothetical protein PKY59_03135 [Pyrinomonadaceae bacterium]|nr:hypothetical protein [Pyrinomonadaceae bacterium]
MIETLKKSDELKTVKLEKDTWILEVPAEICRKEGFAEGTMVSLTFKDSGIQSSYIHPTENAKKSAERFIGKYGDFMKEMQEVDG